MQYFFQTQQTIQTQGYYNLCLRYIPTEYQTKTDF